jgi:membrane protein
VKLKEAINTLKKMDDKDLMTYASSLSFHTILSVIPMLLISFTVFTKLPSFADYYGRIKEFIFSSIMPSYKDVASEYMDKFIGNALEMGIFGFVTVLIVSMLFFKTYENIFNRIMHTEPRSFWHSLSAYWTLLTLSPILLGVSFYLSNVVKNLLIDYGFATQVNLFVLLPYMIIWTLFFTAYMISSNAKVSVRCGLISSFLASLIWYISKTLFVFYVAYNQTYATIYGSSSVVLFFFVWVYFSWVIFLYGVRICYILHIKELEKKKITKSDNDNGKHKNSPVRASKSQNNINK